MTIRGAYICMLCTRMYVLVFLFSVLDANVLTNVGIVHRWEAVHSAAAELQDYQESESKAEREWSSTSCTEVGPCMCTCVREWKSLSTCLLICLSTCLSVRLPVCSSVCLSHRQQIEDCETEIQRLKELLKKREENERKYHGQLQAFLHPGPPTQLLSSPLLVNTSTLGSPVNDSFLAGVLVLVKQCWRLWS